jgi:hypothetical protein
MRLRPVSAASILGLRSLKERREVRTSRLQHKVANSHVERFEFRVGSQKFFLGLGTGGLKQQGSEIGWKDEEEGEG